jgi:hypothetical protein
VGIFIIVPFAAPRLEIDPGLWHNNKKSPRKGEPELRERMEKLIFLGFGLLSLLASGCDPEGKKECQWTLEPEVNLIGTTNEPGMIPVCVRNRVTNKQDCRFQASMDFAKSAWMKKFKYVDIDSDNSRMPRIIKNIKFCSEK